MSRIPTPVKFQALQNPKPVKASIKFQPRESLASLAGPHAGNMPHKASHQPAQTLNSLRHVADLHTNELRDGRSRLHISVCTRTLAGPYTGELRNEPSQISCNSNMSSKHHNQHFMEDLQSKTDAWLLQARAGRMQYELSHSPIAPKALVQHRIQDSAECVNSTSSVADPHMGKTRPRPRRLPIYVGRPGEHEVPVRASSLGASAILSADLLRQGSEVNANLQTNKTGSKPSRIPTCPKISAQYASARPPFPRHPLELPAKDFPPAPSETAAGSPAVKKRSIPRRISAASQPGLTSSIKYVPLKDLTRPTSVTKPTPTTKAPPQKPSLGITGSKFHEDLNGDVPGYGQDANIMHSLDTLQGFVRFYPKKAASSQALLPPRHFTEPRTRAQYDADVRKAAQKQSSYKTLIRADAGYLLPRIGRFGQGPEEVVHARQRCQAPPAGHFTEPRTRAQYEAAVKTASLKKASYKTLTKADVGYMLPRIET